MGDCQGVEQLCFASFSPSQMHILCYSSLKKSGQRYFCTPDVRKSTRADLQKNRNQHLNIGLCVDLLVFNPVFFLLLRFAFIPQRYPRIWFFEENWEGLSKMLIQLFYLISLRDILYNNDWVCTAPQLYGAFFWRQTKSSKPLCSSCLVMKQRRLIVPDLSSFFFVLLQAH